MTAIALLLAIFRNKPSPFCILDEVDAALDEPNTERLAGVLREFLDRSQFIVVTHKKPDDGGQPTGSKNDDAAHLLPIKHCADAVRRLAG